MGRGNLAEWEIEILRQNPFVVSVKNNRIVYAEEFKYRFMREYNRGKGPSQIFKDAGFDIRILGTKRIERASARWRECYESGSFHEYGKEKPEGRRMCVKKLTVDYTISDQIYEKLVIVAEKLGERGLGLCPDQVFKAAMTAGASLEIEKKLDNLCTLFDISLEKEYKI